MLKRSGTRQLSAPGFALFALGLLLILPCGAFAEDLREPHEIAASGGGIDTQLRVKSQNVTFESGWTDVDPDENTTCYEKTTTTADLRMYGFPGTGADCIEDDSFCYGFPGPTYRMRRGVEGGAEGDTYKLSLTNKLTPNLAMGCSAGGVAYDWDESPNCFHGAEVTNHHFHGFHVSPNPNPDDGYYDPETYSDYIYVKIYPEGQTGVSPSFPETQVGTANYQLAPLSSSQHEGTHWYHPHKHGATAEQVGNGMAGAFIVEGPYDDWVETEVCAGSTDGANCALEEKVLVVQEILSQFVFPPQSGTGALFPVNSAQLVNGQLYPKVSIAPGEVQRWRVVNATMKAGSAFYFLFPPDFDVRQIGMDGVPFVEGNYNRQPLLGSWNSGNSSCDIPTADGTLPTGTLCVLLHPGNRGDFLVQRPADTKRVMKRAARGRKAAGKRLEADAVPLFHQRPFFSNSIRERRPKEVTTRRKRTNSCAHPNLPGLFEVNECPGDGCDPKDMSFPSSNYPALDSLATISNYAKERTLTYEIEGYAGAQFPAPFDGSPEDALLQQINSEVGTCQYLLPQFTIDGQKFKGDRIDQKMLVNTSEQWKFDNQAAVPVIPDGAPNCPGLDGYVKTGADCSSVVLPPGQTQCLQGVIKEGDHKDETVTTPFPATNPIQHPVHLHVNPFQVWASDDGRKSGEPYVWQDVMGLNLTGGQATMRSTFEEITGEYVMHCHILGHEDRGMMQNLEVCTGCTSE